MKQKLLLLMLFYAFQVAASIDSFSGSYNKENLHLIEKIRTTYYAGVENDKYIDSLDKVIVNNFGKILSDYPPVILAYHAGIYALKSKHAFWPLTKMNYLTTSMNIFERAINADPSNLEIRFMRFSILYYVPGILGYNDAKMEDLREVNSLLLKNDYLYLDRQIQTGMIEFLLKTKLLTEKQEQKLKEISMLANADE